MQKELMELRKKTKELEGEMEARARRERVTAEQMDMKEAITKLRAKYDGDYMLLGLSKTQGDVVEAAVYDKEKMKDLLHRMVIGMNV